MKIIRTEYTQEQIKRAFRGWAEMPPARLTTEQGLIDGRQMAWDRYVDHREGWAFGTAEGLRKRRAEIPEAAPLKALSVWKS